MGMSKSSRIITLLVIDSVFFLLELSTGYAVHSLALVADAFHMLNDVLSLLVGLWAVKMANKRSAPKIYTYGYQRAETLGALVNGVFLVALCVTIFLDAISRFVEPQEVTHPKLMFRVGCLGLFFNIGGLVLFHDHSHGHGGHGHSHANEAEEGHVHESHIDEPQGVSSWPSAFTARSKRLLSKIGLMRSHDRSHGHEGHGYSHVNEASEAEEGHARHVHDPYTDEPHGHSHEEVASVHAKTQASSTTAVEELASKTSSPHRSKRRYSRTASRTGIASYEEYPGPSAFRNSIINAAERMEEDAEDGDDAEPTNQREPLLAAQQSNGYGTTHKKHLFFDHTAHKHAQPKEAGKGNGHSHSDLNMKGIFLHVIGDALGNIAVIATALVIQFTDFKARIYFDPAISLLITIIILCSAIPLCKAASRILLQAVPEDMELDNIRHDIELLEGVESAHHLHVWQLSDSKLVASLHVRVTFNFKGEGSQRYMQLASEIRECLHEYGIHSSTIQPEFHADSSDIEDQRHDFEIGARDAHDTPRSGSLKNSDQRCLLDCDDCGNNKSCCPPSQPQKDDSHNGHAH